MRKSPRRRAALACSKPARTASQLSQASIDADDGRREYGPMPPEDAGTLGSDPISALMTLESRLAEVVASEVDWSETPTMVLRQLTAVSALRRLRGCIGLLQADIGATVVAAAVRGLLETALQNMWLAERPELPAAALSVLGQERQRVRNLIAKHGLTVPNQMRWLHPVARPTLAAAPAGPGLPDGLRLQQKQRHAVAGILGMSAAVGDMLALASHASGAAAWCTVADPPHPVGMQATAPHAAVFAQGAGRAAVFATSAHSDAETQERMRALSTVARSLHGLPGTPPPQGVEGPPSTRASDTAAVLPLPASPLTDQLLTAVIEAATRFREVLVQGPNPFSGPPGPVNLRPALPYLTAISTAEVAIGSVDSSVSPDLGPIAARMLLEEGARSQWLFGGSERDEEMRRRYVAIADEETWRRSVIRAGLLKNGASNAAVERLLDPLPAERVPSLYARRTPANQKAPVAPPPYEQLIRLGVGFAEEGWLDLAYALLSQVTHATPLGLLHMEQSPGCSAGLSPEMAALTLDAACLGASVILPPLAAILCMNLGFAAPGPWVQALRAAAMQVHHEAQIVHFLD